MNTKIKIKNINVNALIRTKEFKIGFIAIMALFFFLFAKKTFIYLFFIAFTAFIIYYTKLYHVPVDVSPLFFLEIVITRYYGIQYTLLYILLAYIVPKTFAGTNMKVDSYVFITISMLANAFALIFPTVPLILVGFLTSIVQYFGGIFYNTINRPLFIAIADGIANVLNNIIWFLLFSDVIVWLFR